MPTPAPAAGPPMSAHRQAPPKPQAPPSPETPVGLPALLAAAGQRRAEARRASLGPARAAKPPPSPRPARRLTSGA
jgi:hypothetical protein